MEKLKSKQLIEVEIYDFAYGGKGISRVETEAGSYTLFVTNTLPGQKVLAKITKVRKKFAEAKLIRVLTLSPEERDQGFQSIGGAPYINLPIERQHHYKKISCQDQYKRYAEIENWDEIFDEFIESPQLFHYRNKVEYSFSYITYDEETHQQLDGFALGYKPRGNWWAVQSIKKATGLFDPEVDEKLHLISEFCENTGLDAWHPIRKFGFFKNLLVRKSFSQNKLLFFLITNKKGIAQFSSNEFYHLLQNLFPNRVSGLFHILNEETGDRLLDKNATIHAHFGERFITENLDGINFKIGIGSFFQTNPFSAVKLYQKAIDYALDGITYEKDDCVMDLFCGAGTISQLFRQKTEVNIIGVDIVEQAIEDARENAIQNGLNHIDYFANEVGKFLSEHPSYKGQIKTIIVDPPRMGIAPKTLKKIINLEAKYLVYISCNPSSQAQDTMALKEAGYQIEKISLVDQFPHTAHTESVALYTKK